MSAVRPFGAGLNPRHYVKVYLKSELKARCYFGLPSCRTRKLKSGGKMLMKYGNTAASSAKSSRNDTIRPDNTPITKKINDHEPLIVEKSDVEPVAETSEPSKQSPWNGLSFLTSVPPASTISNILSTWTWPAPTLGFDFTGLQARFSALLLELGLGPGSLYSEIVNSPPDANVHPECEWDAEVRLGEELCLAERAFITARRRRIKAAFARLMGVKESQVDERDLPVVAIAGSGGGFRAMLNTTGSLIGAEATGILDCVTYTAGVSGSCWALGVLYSGVAGSCDPRHAAQHIKDRIQTGYLDTSTLDALINAPTNKYLLSGLLRKAAGPAGNVSLVDIYGTAVASRLFVPSDLSKLDPRHLSMHFFRRNVDDGSLPMPIFTAIQHATPPEKARELRNVKAQKAVSMKRKRTIVLAHEQAELEAETRCLWYEFTPFEVGCDEIGAWIPSWALGRPFQDGKNIDRRPELSFTILTGIFGSAFCASLNLYFREVQPTLRLLPHQLYTWLEEIINENERDLVQIHPVVPNQLPNFLKGLDGRLRYGSPTDLTQRDTLSFLDAGAELNLPYYPLLRRNVDCIIALDASADSQDLWFTRAEALAAKRGLRTWPKGAGWPASVQSPDHPAFSVSKMTSPSPSPSQAEAVNLKLAKTQETALAEQTERQELREGQSLPDSKASEFSVRTPPLSNCEVWIGSSKMSESDTSRLEDLEEEVLLQRDGIGVVYLPLVPNEQKMPGFDPSSVSTWRREVTAEESQNVLDVAEANFVDGSEKIIKLLRVIWMRKKREREKEEWDRDLQRFREHMGHNVT